MAASVQKLKEEIVSEEREAVSVGYDQLRDHNDFVLQVLGEIRSILDQYGPGIQETTCGTVALFLFTKIVRTCRPIRVLSMAGYGAEAEVLVRSGLEALINLLFITQTDCEERARLFIEFEHVLAKQYSDRVDRWPKLFLGLELSQRRKDTVEQSERVKGNYPKKYFWAAKLIPNGGLKEMAKQVGDGLDLYYDFFYWLGSNQTHSNIRAANEYTELTELGLKYKLGPDLKRSTGPLSMACDLMIRALECIINLFNIQEQGTINELKEQYARIFGKGDTPLTKSN